jgi:hypothetical protein
VGTQPSTQLSTQLDSRPNEATSYATTRRRDFSFGSTRKVVRIFPIREKSEERLEIETEISLKRDVT